MLTIDDIIAMPEDELRARKGELAGVLFYAQLRLDEATADLAEISSELSADAARRTDDWDRDIEFCMGDTLTPAELDTVQMEDLKWRIRDRLDLLAAARSSEARRNREDFETFCWAWAEGVCWSGGEEMPDPTVNPWPYRR